LSRLIASQTSTPKRSSFQPLREPGPQGSVNSRVGTYGMAP
jgi:hypothetical protein